MLPLLNFVADSSQRDFGTGFDSTRCLSRGSILLSLQPYALLERVSKYLSPSLYLCCPCTVMLSMVDRPRRDLSWDMKAVFIIGEGHRCFCSRTPYRMELSISRLCHVGRTVSPCSFQFLVSILEASAVEGQHHSGVAISSADLLDAGL